MKVSDTLRDASCLCDKGDVVTAFGCWPADCSILMP